MDELLVVLGLFFGFLLRIAIPVGLTFLLTWLLQRLDARWKAEAEQWQAEEAAMQAGGRLEPCWRVKGCPQERRQACPAYKQREIPCWEVYRRNGILQEACRDCVVRKKALALAGI